VRLYLDANPIIYTVEANPAFQAEVLHWVREAEAANGLLVTSRLSQIECRSHPMRNSDQETLARFDRFFASDNLVLFDVSGDVIQLATELRARYNFHSADAIHLATAILIGADVFLTGDAVLARCTDIRVVVLTAQPAP
jgi:predicted nucleic acid-binding protein